MKALKLIRKLVHTVTDALQWLPPYSTRLVVAQVFIESGWGKLTHLDKVIGFFTSLGIPAPQIQAPFVAATELTCGTLILIGLGSRIAALPLIGTMAVALITAKKEDIHQITDLFSISEFLYIPLLVWIAVFGAGKLSLDRWIGKKLT